MKKIYKYLFGLVFLNINLFSQQGWIKQNSGVTNELTSVCFVDPNYGFVSGRNGTILKTTDGGNNWSFNQSNTIAWLYSILFLDQQLGWAAGSEFQINKSTGVILKTTDGGVTWDVDTLDSLPNKIFFVNKNTGWILCSNNEIYPNYHGIIMKTSDGGESWIPQTEGPQTSYFDDLFFIDENEGYVVGHLNSNSTGIILKTSDSGVNWQTYPYSFNYPLFSVCFTDLNNGWIAGAGGILLQTTDGGINWNTLQIGREQNIYDIFFLNNEQGWTAGASGEILSTTDGGENWQHQDSEIELPLYSIIFADEYKGWAVGNYGIILHTISGGITTINDSSTSIPKHFLLNQNYPNPFNPTTTIKYQIPQAGFVSLKVYDMLGKEVAILVNEEKPVGSYEVEFNGSRIPSGIYFYQLQSGSFVETKKLILVK